MIDYIQIISDDLLAQFDRPGKFYGCCLRHGESHGGSGISGGNAGDGWGGSSAGASEAGREILQRSSGDCPDGKHRNRAAEGICRGGNERLFKQAL